MSYSSYLLRFFFFLSFFWGSLLPLTAQHLAEIGEKNNSSIEIAFYCEFLNSQAAIDNNHFFEKKMADDAASACIQRSGTPGSYYYEVSSGIANRSVPYISTSAAMAYAEWKGGNETLSVAGDNEVDPELKSNILFFEVIPSGSAVECFSKEDAAHYWQELNWEEKTFVVAGGLFLVTGGAFAVDRYRHSDIEGRQGGSGTGLQEDQENAHHREVIEENGEVGERLMVDDITGMATNEDEFQRDQRSWVKKWADSVRGRRDVYSVFPGADQVEYIPDVDPLPESRSRFQKIIYFITKPLYRYPSIEAFKTLLEQLQKKHKRELQPHQDQLAEQQEELEYHRTQAQLREEQDRLSLENQMILEAESQQQRRKRMELFHENVEKNRPNDQLRKKYAALELEIEFLFLKNHQTLFELKKWEDIEERVDSYEEAAGDSDSQLSHATAEKLKQLFQKEIEKIEEMNHLLDSLRGNQDAIRIAEHVINDPLVSYECSYKRWFSDAEEAFKELEDGFNTLLQSEIKALAAEREIKAREEQKNDRIGATKLALDAALLSEAVDQKNTSFLRRLSSVTTRKKKTSSSSLRKSLDYQTSGLEKMEKIEENVDKLFLQLTPFMEYAIKIVRDSFSLVHHVENNFIKIERLIKLMEADMGVMSTSAHKLNDYLGTVLIEARETRDQAISYLDATSSLIHDAMKPLSGEAQRAAVQEVEENQSTYEVIGNGITTLFSAIKEKVSMPLKNAKEATLTILHANAETTTEALIAARQQLYELMKQLEKLSIEKESLPEFVNSGASPVINMK